MSPDVLLPAAVLAPAAAATITLPLPAHRRNAVGVVGALLCAAIGLALVVAVVRSGGLEHTLAGWAPPLGIALRADGLSAVFIALTSIVAPATALYAASEDQATGRRPGFWPLSFLVWCGLLGCFVTGDFFNAYVALEVLSLSAVGLVAIGGSTQAVRAALRYLSVAVGGSFLVLLAVGFVYAATGTLDFVLAGEILREEPDLGRIPLALAAVGLALKAALVPLHAWLPPAHASAPPAVSAILSALAIKGSYYLLLRLWIDVFEPDAALALVLGLLGALAVVGGGLVALRQEHLKRVVAYSTITQVGYLFLVFPLLTAATTPELRGYVVGSAAAMAVAHGLAKAALFLSAGTLLLGVGSDRIADLVGISRHQRGLTIATMLSAASLVGLPVTLGFVAKWQYLTAAVEVGQWWIVAVLVVGSLLAAAYLLRPLASFYQDSDESEEFGRADPSQRPLAQRWVPLGLAAAAVLTGLLAPWFMTLTLVGGVAA